MTASVTVREARQEFSVIGWLAVALTLVVLTSAGVARLSELVQEPAVAEPFPALTVGLPPWDRGDAPEAADAPGTPPLDVNYGPARSFPADAPAEPWTTAVPRPEPPPADLAGSDAFAEGGLDPSALPDPEIRWTVRDLPDADRR